MQLWLNESCERGKKTGILDRNLSTLAKKLFNNYKSYFDHVKPIMYCGDIGSKNVMILNGAFNGLVDVDELTQGDPLEAVGRIKLSWCGTHHGNVYTNAVMNAMQLNDEQRKIVTLGYEDEMMKALQQAADLIKSDLNFHEIKEVIIFFDEYNDSK